MHGKRPEYENVRDEPFPTFDNCGVWSRLKRGGLQEGAVVTNTMESFNASHHEEAFGLQEKAIA
jgi:hypothetical protein